MTSKADVRALVSLLPFEEGGRKSGVSDGYRPQHLVTNDILTSGLHTYINDGYILPGNSAQAFIKFIAPENYPNCLWIGKVINLQEGNRVIGYATIEHIFNPVLIAVVS